MDNDTSAVVIVAGLILIAVVIGYMTYNYVANTSREPAVFNFKNNAPFSHMAIMQHLCFYVGTYGAKPHNAVVHDGLPWTGKPIL